MDSQTQLTLTSPTVASYTGSTYTISRQYKTLADWEDCIDGPPGVVCSFFPVSSNSLVADNRREVGSRTRTPRSPGRCPSAELLSIYHLLGDPALILK